MLEVIDGRAQSTPVHISRPRPPAGAENPADTARSIVDEVRLGGDAKLLELTRKLDGAELEPGALRVDPHEITAARKLVRPEFIDALEVMAERLRTTAERQLPKSWVEERPDERIGEIVRPLRRVGIYAPGGRAVYPSSVMMAAVPAKVAGVEGLAVASPPDANGKISEAVLAACSVAGVNEVYRMGGAQAIAALAYGTETVRPVEKIVGPGNVFVAHAKRIVRGWVGTETDAGPTEIAIIADESASARVVAADLVAQAEHGPNGTHALITWSEELIEQTLRALELEVGAHARPDDVENALIEGGRAVLVNDIGHAFDTANAFAPEHLELLIEEPDAHLDSVRNAGAVFLGPFSPVPAGDYVAGTNHVLPSGGTARFSSGLSAADFVKKIYLCDLERSSLTRLSPHIDALAEAEGLFAHARAVNIRLGRLGKT
jgi:histidinol dehydrogenase